MQTILHTPFFGSTLSCFLLLLAPILASPQSNRSHESNDPAYRNGYQRMASGAHHTLELRGGKLYAWGKNDSGQLGIGTTQSDSTPQRVGSDSNWVSVSAGDHHSVGLKANGTLWAWGANDSGQVGDGSTTMRTSPTMIGNDSNWVSVSAGGNHTLALTAGGLLYAWGANSKYQCSSGAGHPVEDRPTLVSTQPVWDQVQAGGQHSLALRADGTLYAWGSNSHGQLGDGSGSRLLQDPTKIWSDSNWVELAAGDSHSLGIKYDGSLYAWGSNDDGQLGDGGSLDADMPVPVAYDDTTWVNVQAGGDHSLGMTANGMLFSWGKNDYGQLGDGSTSDTLKPELIAKGIMAASAGRDHTTSLRADGKLYAWGQNLHGQLGNGSTDSSETSPIEIREDPDTWVSISSSVDHSAGLKSDGSLWMWGRNSYGQLGDGTIKNDSVPQEVDSSRYWTNVDVGWYHTLALSAGGTLWAWGRNDYGQLGDGTTTQRQTPVQVGSDATWVSIEASSHSVGLKADGTLWAWGVNDEGQVGNGTSGTYETTPQQIGAGEKWVQVETGSKHTVALTADGKLWAWGDNYYGQLGDGSGNDQNSPVLVSSERKWVSIAAEGNHTLALSASGKLYAWGLNDQGQLGTGGTTNESTPVQVGSDIDWMRIGAGVGHSSAIKANGSLWSWGDNAGGELGVGSTSSQYSPTKIPKGRGFIRVEGGDSSTTSLERTRSRFCATGQNNRGQHGDWTTQPDSVFRCSYEPDSLVLSISGTDLDCYQDSSGMAVATASGGVPPYSYSWSPSGQSGDTADGLSAGKQYLTFSDANGDTIQDSVLIEEPDSLSLSTSTLDVTCAGDSNGEASVSVTGGTMPYSYDWSTGDTTNSIDSLSPGDYSITVMDANGCSKTDTVSISEPAPLSLSMDSSSVSCAGDSDGVAFALVSGGTTPYSYSWSNGDTAGYADSLAPGMHYVTVTDSNNCSAYDSVRIDEPAPLSLSTSSVDLSCAGDSNGEASVSVTGGTMPYSYLWSNGDTNSLADTLSQGKHYIYVTDSNGCSASDSVFIDEPSPLSLSTNSDDITCSGLDDGEASVSVSGGTTPYSYSWNNGDTTVAIDSLSAGTYDVTVSDSNGCTATDTLSISEPAPLNLSMASADLSCAGASDGEATVVVNGGTMPYTYAWSQGDSSSTVDSLSAGKYTVLVSDSNGCTAVDSVTIGEPTPLSLSFSSQNVTCDGTDDGSLTVSPSGGVKPYSYDWSTGDTTATTDSLQEGTYSVTVTDSNGCTMTGSRTIGTQSSLTVSTSVTDAACGKSNGSATANVSGGSSPYSYVWSSGDTSQTADSLSAGNYTVQISDANGCEAFASVDVNNSGGVTASIASVSDVSCPGGMDGAVDVDVSGGSTPYSYKWSNGDTTQDLSNVSAGSYSLQVRDGDSCLSSVNVTVDEPAPLALSFTTTDASCDSSDGEAMVSVSGGTSPYDYQWSNGSDSAKAVGLGVGDHMVTVTDSSGCVDSAQVMISESGAPTVSVTNVQNTGCGSSERRTAPTTGGTGSSSTRTAARSTARGRRTATRSSCWRTPARSTPGSRAPRPTSRRPGR